MIRMSTYNMYAMGTWYIDSDQSAMMTTEAELASGKKLNSPSDNPLGAGEAALLQSNEAALGQYSSNQSQATDFLNNASSTLTQVTNVLQSVNTSLVEAGSPTLGASGRSALASQLQQDLNQIVGLANTSDNQGGYLFSGSVTDQPPFLQVGNTVNYVGDSVETSLQISQTRSEQVKYPGSSIFMQIPTGNGTFATSAGSGNTGSGSISEGTVVKPSLLTGDSYTIDMGGGSGPGTAATTYTVVDTTTGAPVATGSYSSPTTLTFAGMQVVLSGAANAGDTFAVAPSQNQSVFQTIAGAIAALQGPQGAASSAQLSSALTNLGQAISSISSSQAAMGAQLGELQTYSTINSDQNLQDQTQVSSIVDLDYAQGVSQLTQQQTQYQAALQSYASISKLSLFNYVA
jgi:flagellar hook-associated protein 3 FlgL